MKGKDVPKPIKTWSQAGLSKKVMDVLKKNDYEKPTPIQAQGIPVILSGERTTLNQDSETNTLQMILDHSYVLVLLRLRVHLRSSHVDLVWSGLIVTEVPMVI